MEKAKARRGRKRLPTTPEERELALAWLRGEITLTQAAHAMNPEKPISGSALSRFAVCLRDAYHAGRITLEA